MSLKKRKVGFLDSRLEDVCAALDELSNEVLAATDNDMSLRQWYGWTLPALNRHDLAFIPKDLANRLRGIGDSNLSEELLERVAPVAERLRLLKSETIPNLFNGNGAQAVQAFLGTFTGLNNLISSHFAWNAVQEGDMLPPQLW